MTKGKFVFTIIVVLVIAFDTWYIVVNGFPGTTKENPTPTGVLIILSSAACLATCIGFVVNYIVRNWDKPFR